VFALDELPNVVVPRPSVIVINTDPSTKPGQHWVAVYITREGVAEYFDSYGKPVYLSEIKWFLKKNGDAVRSNNQSIQGTLSTVCGQYCIFFLLHRCRGLSMTKIVHLFSNDKTDNDIIVNDFVRRRFPRVKTTLYDEPFIVKQISKSMMMLQ
jgi:hypothetical protein